MAGSTTPCARRQRPSVSDDFDKLGASPAAAPDHPPHAYPHDNSDDANLQFPGHDDVGAFLDRVPSSDDWAQQPFGNPLALCTPAELPRCGSDLIMDEPFRPFGTTPLPSSPNAFGADSASAFPLFGGIASPKQEEHASSAPAYAGVSSSWGNTNEAPANDLDDEAGEYLFRANTPDEWTHTLNMHGGPCALMLDLDTSLPMRSTSASPAVDQHGMSCQETPERLAPGESACASGAVQRSIRFFAQDNDDDDDDDCSHSCDNHSDNGSSGDPVADSTHRCTAFTPLNEDKLADALATRKAKTMRTAAANGRGSKGSGKRVSAAPSPRRPSAPGSGRSSPGSDVSGRGRGSGKGKSGTQATRRAALRQADEQWPEPLLMMDIKTLRKVVPRNTPEYEQAMQARRRFQGRTHKQSARSAARQEIRKAEEIRERLASVQEQAKRLETRVQELMRQCGERGISVDTLLKEARAVASATPRSTATTPTNSDLASSLVDDLTM